MASGAVARKGGSSNCGFLHAGTITYALQVTCDSSSLTLNRLWQHYFDDITSFVCCDGSVLPPINYVDYLPDNPCTGYSSSFTFTPSDCLSFTASGTLVPTSGSHDPWGTSVTIEGPVTDPGSCCDPCPVPQHDLTLAWTNSLIGNGSTTLTYSSGPDAWTSACVGQVKYKLTCVGSNTVLDVEFYPSNDCPTGTPQGCTSTNAVPNQLTFDTSYTCEPFMLKYTLTSTSCSNLWSNGFTSFKVTYP